MLRSLDEERLGVRLLLPVAAGFSEFGNIADISIDNLATVSLVPTAEFILPIDSHWTLLPFAGLGGAVQLGDQDLVGGERWVGLATGGARIERWQALDQRYTTLFTGQVRYDAVLADRNGLLGDWASADASIELRRSFGRLETGPMFQAGIYVQATRFLDPVELELEGVSPAYIDDAREVGISLGSSQSVQVLGISLPRVFLGYRSGSDVQTYLLRLGRL